MSSTHEIEAQRLPASLRPLARVAWNYAWSWLPDGPQLFEELDPELWRRCGHNPVRLLRELSEARLAELGKSRKLKPRIKELVDRFDAAVSAETSQPPVAYFCAEFAIHESLPIYSGGLGVLAGDYLKSASDMKVPVVGVGLLYRQGYFQQRFSQDGWQLEEYPDVAFHDLPVSLLRDREGRPVVIEIPILDHTVRVQVWETWAGRSRLLLLDTNREDNSEIDRWISGHLYGGDRDTRIRQEILLGIGGVRALRALGIEPSVYHMNEGHAAFLTLELARERVARGENFHAAREELKRQVVFTTHTPVPAGNDVFGLELVDAYLGPIYPQLGISRDEFLALGRRQPEDSTEPFGMTPLALRMTHAANGVSIKHAEVSRGMWQPIWPERLPADVPIEAVTNGVHPATWLAPEMRALLDRYLPEGWHDRAGDPDAWSAVDNIPDAELWSVHLGLKKKLIAVARERAYQDRLSRGEQGDYLQSAHHLFDPDCLLLGFARRVATYKRLKLLLSDRERALDLVSRAERPVHILIAGKAHPQDQEAKGVLQWFFEQRYEPRLWGGTAILAGYDVELAARMVQGCDGWLNLPRRPQEASGTSGMKAAMNAVLNVSILDGWWLEGYDGTNGWAVGSHVPGDADYQDEVDGASLYEIVEKELIPLYYDRDENGVPGGWVYRMKRCLKTLGPQFSSHRMVQDYVRLLYHT